MVNNCKGCSFRKNCDYIKRKTDTKICSSYKNFKNYLSQIEPYKAYYSDFFYTYIPDQINEKNKPKLRYEKDIYNIFRILSIVRQSCFHDQNSTRTKIYKIDDFEIVEMLDRLYGQKISDVNKGFCKTNKKNISVLFYIYNVKNDEDKAELVSDFYKYVVIKENKNLGFSVKHLREKLLEDNEFKFLTFQKYDSNRHKLYLLLDYMIYRYYNENQEQLTDFVDQLRATLNDEDKETLYADHAGVIKSAIGHIIIEKLAPKMLGSSISKEGKAFINFNWIENVQLGSSASRFSEIIYIMTMFLDGKEINELLSALISKFENIQSLVEVLKYANLPHSFAEGYEIFEKSGEVAYEIRAIKSFSRMQGKIAGFSKEIFEDAAETLGMRNENTDLSEYIDEHIYSKDKNMRNFIINNVLESNRFLYLVRYNNPKRTKKLVSNMPLVKFVLSRMPESQIERYYSSVINGQDDLSNDKKITALAKKITTMDFEQFENVQQKVKLKSKEAIEKERLKALVGLYLTVAYLITKNLVKINARYSIAISCHERDTQIFEINHMTNPATKEPVQPYITLTEKFIDEGKEVYLFSFCEHEGDLRTIDRILDLMDDSYSSRVNIIDYTGKAGDLYYFVKLYSRMEKTICTRFHSLVMSLIFKQELMVISYSDKLNNLLDDLGYEFDVVNIDNKIGKLVINNDDFKVIDDKTLNKFKREALRHFESLDKSLKIRRKSKKLKIKKNTLRSKIYDKLINE